MSLHKFRRRGGGAIIRYIKDESELQLSTKKSTWTWKALVSINNNDIMVGDSIKFYSLSSYPQLAELNHTIIGNLQDIFSNKGWHEDDSDDYIYWFQCVYYGENNNKIGVIIFYLGTNGKRIYENMRGYNTWESTFYLTTGGFHAYNIRIFPFRHSETDGYSINSELTRLSVTASATCGNQNKSADVRILSEWSNSEMIPCSQYYQEPIGFYGNPALNHAFVTFNSGKIGSLSVENDDYVTSDTLLTTAPIVYSQFYW